MRLPMLPGQPQLTYCTNIHAVETWEEIATSLDAHVPAIKAAVCPDATFGIGLRLSGTAAAVLAKPEAMMRFRKQLRELGAYVFTINAFPYGPFHGTCVKQHVYEPDWRTFERLAFTGACGGILAELLNEGEYGSISTVPGAFRPVGDDPAAPERIVNHLLQAAASLSSIRRNTGRTIALALEPEPACLMETTEEARQFIEEQLLRRASLARFAELADLEPAQTEASLRRHLGICYDVCHGAVEFEDPVAELRSLKAAGIAVPKIQLSTALRIPEMTPARLERLKTFDDGVYLHQVVVWNGVLQRFVDLPEAVQAFEAGGARGEWRVHCHVPVFLASVGELQSTGETLSSVLRALRDEPLSPHLEVETYTWDVLPEGLRTGSKAQDIVREMKAVMAHLQPETERCRPVPQELVS